MKNYSGINSENYEPKRFTMPRCCQCVPNLSWFPIALGIVSCATFIGSYTIAVSLGHVEPYFPYISDTGTTSPESCIFGQFLNMSAFLSFVCVCIRYKLIAAFRDNLDRTSHILNKTSLVLGCISSLGLSIVANFQESNIEPVHLSGASLVFVLGVGYMLTQASLSYKMYPSCNGILIARIRLTVGIIGLISMTSAFISAVISRELWSDNPPKDHTKIHWKPSDPGFEAHIVSTMSEWVMAFSFVLYFFTYIRDFQKMRLKVDMHLFVAHLDERPIFTGSHGPLETSSLLA
ncbi:DNA damage-regulated autophagy modulator protein 1-like isoform X2 [Tubulanus polymorphus]|uniref:DNA damage-regulated autophagy modulator protein 1-like isoform X2 n=1 Tax=Tubulanus polymorphus TaxID=672921 RepID=UPI003DA4FF5A